MFHRIGAALFALLLTAHTVPRPKAT
ncbi:hypothetical protein HaLaN_28023, partial [Haematococcus lacustris]